MKVALIRDKIKYVFVEKEGQVCSQKNPFDDL